MKWRSILFSPTDELVMPFQLWIESQERKTVVMWALDTSEMFLSIYEQRHPQDTRLRDALHQGLMWARGYIKIQEGRHASLSAHALAKEESMDLVSIACAHAIGQAIASIHVKTHALGVVLYGLTALRRLEIEILQTDLLHQGLMTLWEKTQYWETQIEKEQGPWASFL